MLRRTGMASQVSPEYLQTVEEKLRRSHVKKHTELSMKCPILGFRRMLQTLVLFCPQLSWHCFSVSRMVACRAWSSHRCKTTVFSLRPLHICNVDAEQFDVKLPARVWPTFQRKKQAAEESLWNVLMQFSSPSWIHAVTFYWSTWPNIHFSAPSTYATVLPKTDTLL